jgi:hypothetical protein
MKNCLPKIKEDSEWKSYLSVHFLPNDQASESSSTRNDRGSPYRILIESQAVYITFEKLTLYAQRMAKLAYDRLI